jgi:ubiquitin carboxyl-terminal hydrolase 1
MHISNEDTEDATAEEQSQAQDEEAKEVKDEEAEAEADAPLGGEQWWRFSDDTVYAVSEDEAHQGNVFMLFYERIDPDEGKPSAAAPTTLPITADAPLPPTTLTTTTEAVEEALTSPLPAEDNVEDFEPPVAMGKIEPPATLASMEETEANNSTASETSEAEHETEPAPTSPTAPQLSPHTMRTAGASAETRGRNQGSRASLPLVSAT